MIINQQRANEGMQGISWNILGQTYVQCDRTFEGGDGAGEEQGGDGQADSCLVVHGAFLALRLSGHP